tara:strand:+ start:240 stop:845 length:606 start_codon:yes stop_codon:yes gene_type:complete
VFPTHHDVVVVGNGPLSDIQRMAIGRAGMVVRINGAHNMLPNERCDVICLREHYSKRGMLSSDLAKVAYTSCSNVVVFVTDMTYESVHIQRIQRFLPNAKVSFQIIYDPRTCDNSNQCGLNRVATLFSHTVVLPEIYVTGWTMGILVLNYVYNEHLLDTIHVYGMNWSGNQRFHPFQLEGVTIFENCDRCVVHPTAKETYR